VSHSDEYERRLRSRDWAQIRRDRIIDARWHCERCGDLSYDLELHHRDYDTLGDETPEDVELLCKVCHRRADAERRRRVEAARWAARVDGWASKVYGEEWELTHGYEEVDEAFGDWLALGGGEDGEW
jgi:5-methylcytosine-specific restriction endonuclease McrA